MSSSHTPSGPVVAFDDDHAVANAGLALTATLTEASCGGSQHAGRDCFTRPSLERDTCIGWVGLAA
jgi:hypothetical protein